MVAVYAQKRVSCGFAKTLTFVLSFVNTGVQVPFLLKKYKGNYINVAGRISVTFL